MARRSLGIVLVVSMVLMAFLVTAVDNAMAKDSPKQVVKTCKGIAKACKATCDKLTAGRDACLADCAYNEYVCAMQGGPVPTGPPKQRTNTQPPRGNQVGQDVNVGGAQVDGGTKLKDRVGQHNLDLGGAQQLQQSGGTSGTSTIQRSKKR